MDRGFREFYNNHANKVYTFILWLTQNRSSADDILQEVFVKAWKSEKIPSEQGEQLPWLYRVARNAAIDHYRKTRRFTDLKRDYTLEQKSCCGLPTEDKGIWAWLEKLAYTEKSILYLHLRDGYSYREIGEIMGMTENNVRVKAFRALKKLKENSSKKAL
ncbi:RNA polymerase ECF-type sigma factor [Chitinispirillum alkaliphilum]|nr:RNA polymerase ECF-type sigma factor [Chitinispirillum alkaliphilum]